MLNNLKIGVRLMLLVAVMSACLVGVGVVGLRGIAASHAGIDTVYNDRVVPLRDLKVIADMYAVNIVDTTHKTRDGTVAPAAALRSLDEASQIIDTKWRAYLATFLVEEERRLITEIEPLMATADQELARLRKILEAGDQKTLAEFAAVSLYPAIDPVAGKFADLIETQLKVAHEVYTDSQSRYDTTYYTVMGLIIGALVLGIGFGYAIIRSISDPLRQVCDGLSRMARGDLSVDLADTGRCDEVGEMTRAASRITATVKAVAQDLLGLIGAAKAGALSARAEPAQHVGEFGVLVRGANELVEVLTAPLFEVAGVMARLASGDVRGRIAGTYDGDLRALKGNVNRSLDALVGLLDEVSSFAGALAQGDVTRTVSGSYQGDFATLKINLNRAVEQFRAVMITVAQSTGQVAASATETTAAAVDVSRQATQQMATLTEVSGAIEQTVAAVGEIARSAERGSLLARNAAACAEDGREKLDNLAAAVARLADANLRISQISAVIADIADKTYVLALNAGLEAVRAGDQGRGFGLIARQITKLAEEVGQATREIRVLVEDAGQNAATGTAAVGTARVAMGQIVATSRDNGSTVQTIAAAIEEQNATVQVLKERVVHMAMLGQATAGAAEEISVTMEALTAMANHLKEQTARIRVA